MARTRHWSFGHQNNKHYRYVRVELRNTWNSPFKKRFVILCTHGCCYFTAPMLPRFLRTRCCFRFSCAYFSQQIFFFESFHESRTTPSESIEVKWYYVVASLKLSKTFTTKLSTKLSTKLFTKLSAKLSTKLSTKWSLKLFMKLSQNLPSKLYTKLSSKGTQEILPFQRVVWSYSLMAAASSLLCSLGFYVARCCFRFSCAYFSQQIFFFESFHESRTTPSKSIEVKSLSLNLFQFYILGRSFQMCWMLLKKNIFEK